MLRRKLILPALVAVALIGLVSAERYSHPRIIGNMPTADVREIQRVAALQLKHYKWEVPNFGWSELRDFGFFVKRVRRYAALHILWIDVTDERSAQVVLGLDMRRVQSDGWRFTMTKAPKWQVTGASYWGSSGGFPTDVRIPTH